MGVRAPAPPLLQVAQAWGQGLKMLLEVRGPFQGQAAGRGGVDGLKEDLQEAKDAVTGEGSLADKAKGVVEAIKGDADGDGK